MERPFFWIDAFAYPALFLWHTGKSVSRDVDPKSSEFSPEHYATLVAYPAPFHKLGERQRDEDEPKLLETTVGRVVSLLPVASDHSSRELKASVDNLFDEGEVVSRRSRVILQVVFMVLKLRDDYQALGGPTVSGKSQSSIQRLLVEAVQNAEVRGGAIPTFPFVSSSVSTMPKHEGGDHTELLAGANLRTIGSLTFMPIIMGATTTTPTANPVAIAKRNSSCLDDGDVWRVMVDEFSPLKFFASVCGMEHEQLFTEFNGGAARQMSLSMEKDALLKAKDEEIRILEAQLVLKEAEAARPFVFVLKLLIFRP
uniref:Uncharacterized protein n=1 Tax=Tanacetum cinerariifolium TaxID=118510 RepID=A0A699KT46_TANCI|nr:hypothetical protein [Tanacetum cinerariifolium]